MKPDHSLLIRFALAIAVVSLLVTPGCSLRPSLCVKEAFYRPDPDTLVVGEEVQLHAGGLDILRECDRPPPPEIEWSSSEPEIVAVGRSGALKAIRPGQADAVARAKLSTASWSLIVVDPPSE